MEAGPLPCRTWRSVLTPSSAMSSCAASQEGSAKESPQVCPARFCPGCLLHAPCLQSREGPPGGALESPHLHASSTCRAQSLAAPPSVRQGFSYGAYRRNDCGRASRLVHGRGDDLAAAVLSMCCCSHAEAVPGIHTTKHFVVFMLHVRGCATASSAPCPALACCEAAFAAGRISCLTADANVPLGRSPLVLTAPPPTGSSSASSEWVPHVLHKQQTWPGCTKKRVSWDSTAQTLRWHRSCCLAFQAACQVVRPALAKVVLAYAGLCWPVLACPGAKCELCGLPAGICASTQMPLC